jgi:polysaccharide pyruvyl transferase CsaB
VQGVGKVLLSGYYGFGNTGDEAILASTVESLRAREPRIQIAVLSKDPQGTAKAYGVESYERMSAKEVASAIFSSDLVVFGGGSLLQDSTSFRSLLYYVAVILLSRALGKPVVVYANGIGPVRSAAARILTRFALWLAKKVTVRDPESEKLLKRIGVRKQVRVTADPAFLLSPSPPERCEEILRGAGLAEGAQVVWLALRPEKAPERFYAAFVPVIALLRSRGYEPCLLVMQEQDQVLVPALCDALAAGGQRPVPVVQGLNPHDALAVLGRGRFCLGMRLHTLILAARAAVPFIGVEIDPKIGAFCRAAGCPVLPDPMKTGRVDLVLEFERFMENRDKLEAHLREKLPLFRSLAEDNVEMVLSVLHGITE